MDDMFYQEIAQEESFKYVNHYFAIFKSKVKQQNIDFNSHYDYDCNFNMPFFEKIVFGNDYFLNLFAENQQQLIKQGIADMKEVFEKNEQYKESVVEKFKQDFKEEFAREYISKIDDIIRKHKEELKYAIQDESVYSDKDAYKKEAMLLGEEFSEEERLDYLQDALERREIYGEKVRLYESARDSVAATISQAIFVWNTEEVRRS